MNLATTIEIHQGHGPIAPEPDWIGTIEEYWSANQDLDFGDINDMKSDLEQFGYHRIGGGAAGCFTVCTPAFARILRAA